MDHNIHFIQNSSDVIKNVFSKLTLNCIKNGQDVKLFIASLGRSGSRKTTMLLYLINDLLDLFKDEDIKFAGCIEASKKCWDVLNKTFDTIPNDSDFKYAAMPQAESLLHCVAQQATPNNTNSTRDFYLIVKINNAKIYMLDQTSHEGSECQEDRNKELKNNSKKLMTKLSEFRRIIASGVVGANEFYKFILTKLTAQQCVILCGLNDFLIINHDVKHVQLS